MPKNKLGGNKAKRAKASTENNKKELEFKEDGQEYGQITRMLGNGRCDVLCVDGVKRLCHIRGKMRKKVWCNQGDIVLVSLRDFQDEKGDIITKYTAEDAHSTTCV
ncbi:tif11 [Symbiodinium pilosum]|uniref:Eukaryotic translation initiation factor 4C n=1 Tax=Symbiodinium pilosum TaxID=2952 RepID=A0A812M7H2_SYMPI|nr:tif11 [Symbiodinium pilosum]